MIDAPASIPAKTASLQGAQERRAIAYAQRGIALALLSGLLFALDGMFAGQAMKHQPFSGSGPLLLVPLFCAGVHDFCALLLISSMNYGRGRLAEVGRSLLSKPGRFVIAGAVFGSLLGMGGYMTALQLAGPAYVLPITSLYPALAAVLAVIFLKERIPPRTWIGLLVCVTGAIIVAYTPPEGDNGQLFYLGLAFAALAALGWAAEGVCATSGMDFIEPEVALNVYYLVSALLYLIIVPLAVWKLLPAGRFDGLAVSLFHSPGIMLVAASGLAGALAYCTWYMAMSMTGVSRAMALNISYALWGIVLSFFFTETHITKTLVLGALVMFGGMFLVVGNPGEMLDLRKSDAD